MSTIKDANILVVSLGRDLAVFKSTLSILHTSMFFWRDLAAWYDLSPECMKTSLFWWDLAVLAHFSSNGMIRQNLAALTAVSNAVWRCITHVLCHTVRIVLLLFLL